jgi:hypothetical protein
MSPLRLIWILFICLVWIGPCYGLYGLLLSLLAQKEVGEVVLYPNRFVPMPLRLIVGISYVVYLMYLSVHWFGWGCFLAITLTAIRPTTGD